MALELRPAPAARADEASRAAGRGRWRWEDSLCDGALFAIVLLSNVDFGLLGLSSDEGFDAGRWAFLFPIWFGPAVLVVLSRSLPRTIQHSPLRWFLAWAVWSAITVVWSLEPRLSILIAVPMATLMLFSGWYVTQLGWQRFLRVFSAAALGYLALGFLTEAILGAQPDTGGRMTGLSFGPTDLGIYAALSLVVASALWASGEARTLAQATVAASILSLLLANARGSTISAVIALAVVGATRLGPWRAYATALGLAAAVAVAVLLAGVGTEDLSRSGDAQEITTLTGRTDVWPIAIDMIREDPWIGAGTGSSQDLFEEATREGRMWWQAYNSHNLFLTIGMEQGVIGLALFGAGLVALVRGSRTEPWALAMVVVFLVNGQTEGMTQRPSVSVVALAAVAALATRPRRGAAGPAPGSAGAAHHAVPLAP